MWDYSVSDTLPKMNFKLKFCRCIYSITLLSFEMSDKKLPFNEPKKEKALLLRLAFS